MTLGEYNPPKAAFDAAAVNFAKGVTAAKVSFRLFTALKQFLSMPAYLPEVTAKDLAVSLLKPKEAWDWAMTNLPVFEERWKGRMAGDPRLMATNKDWKMWRNNVVQLCSKYGMSPNAFVDALTVSIGAYAMYKTKYEQYLKDGYDNATADHRANQDAEILYNLTQQSSEGSMMSPMQVDRSWLSVLFSVFRNSSMAYGRQLHDAVRNLKNVLLTPNYRANSISFMAKQYERDGIADAETRAVRKYDRQIRKDLLRVATFGFILQFCWQLGARLPYLIFGDDDDEKEKMMDETLAGSAFGWAEGYTGGDVISSGVAMLITKEINPSYLEKDMPLMSDISSILLKFGYGKNDDAISDVINLVVQSGIGVNPQSITDAVLAVYDACGGDPALAHEAVICISRILQVPQSQINKMYFDEVNLRGDEISKYTPAQLAERYARYRVKRGALYAPWIWNEEGRLDKQKDQATTIVKEHLDNLSDKKVNEDYQKYEEAYKAVREQIGEAKVLAKFGDEKGVEQKLTAIGEKNLAMYTLFGKADMAFDKLVNAYLEADTPEFADHCKDVIVEYKKAMVDALSAMGTDKQEQKLQQLSDILDGFAEYYDNHNQQQPVNKK